MSILCWEKVYEYLKKSIVHDIYVKYIKENGTLLYFCFSRSTFFFSFQGYDTVFLKVKITLRLLERDKLSYN